MDKFATYNLEIDEKCKTLVMQYLQSIKDHVENNWLDDECYSDIEEMFFEKLASLKQINELNIKKIIKEVWEADVIFWEWQQKTNSNQDNLNFYQKLKISAWEYQNDDAIVLWISGILAKKLGLTVWIVRLVLLFLMLFWGLSVWLYFLLWLILPVKGLDYNSKNLTNLIRRQLFYVIKKSIKNVIKSIFLFFPFVIKKTFELIKIIFTNLKPILRFFAFWISWIVFLSFVLVAIFVLAFYYSNFSVWNIVIFSELPIFWVYATIFGLISVLILWIWSLFFAFGSKIFNKNLYILAILSIFVSIFFCIVTGLDLAKKYIWENNFSQKVEYEFQNSDTSVSLDLNKFRNKFLDWVWEINQFELIKTDDKKLTFELKTTIYAWDDIANKLKNNFNDLELNKSWNHFSLGYKQDKTFKNEVPFSFYTHKLVIYVPKDLKLDLNRYWYYSLRSNWEYIKPEYSKYWDFWSNDCYNKTIYFNNNEQKFVCELNNLEVLRQNYIENYLVRNFDNWSKITHKTKYKREDYYEDNYYDFDWNMDWFKWIWENELEVSFSDKTISLTSKLNIKENETSIEVIWQELTRLEFSRLWYYDWEYRKFREEYYNSVEYLSPLISNLK